MLKHDMFFKNVVSFVPGLQNFCSVEMRFLLSAVILPVLLTSNAVTEVCKWVISVTKCAYLLDFSRCLASMFLSRGTVSSNM